MNLRLIAAVYAVVLLFVTALNYIPGLTDAEGRAFGVFALDIYDDGLHLASAIWAGLAALISRAAARFFLTYFGLLYFGDGLLGLFTGSGYLDLGIFKNGIIDQTMIFRLMANLPHLVLGGVAAACGLLSAREAA